MLLLSLNTFLLHSSPCPPWRATGYSQIFHSYPLLLFIAQIWRVKALFQQIFVLLGLWVKLISDFLLFGTSLPLPLEHEQSISCMETFYHGNNLLVSLISVPTSKTSDVYKNAILLNYSVYALPFTKRVLFEIEETFLHPSHWCNSECGTLQCWIVELVQFLPNDLLFYAVFNESAAICGGRIHCHLRWELCFSAGRLS